MPVYVGIDVHRKRSQGAAVIEDGALQLNKNVVNGSEPMLRLPVTIWLWRDDAEASFVHASDLVALVL
jgi:hypothetical protein